MLQKLFLKLLLASFLHLGVTSTVGYGITDVCVHNKISVLDSIDFSLLWQFVVVFF